MSLEKKLKTDSLHGFPRQLGHPPPGAPWFTQASIFFHLFFRNEPGHFYLGHKQTVRISKFEVEKLMLKNPNFNFEIETEYIDTGVTSVSIDVSASDFEGDIDGLATSGRVAVIDIREELSSAFADLRDVPRTVGLKRNFNDI